MVAGRRWGSLHRLVFLALAVLASSTAAPASAQEPQLTDLADDAYRYPTNPVGQPDTKAPNPLLSDDLADILSATYAPVAPRSGHDSAYSVSLTLSAPPHPSYNYLVGGAFGEACFLLHFLDPDDPGDAAANCDGKYVGSIAASAASVKGNTVSATFSFRRSRLPTALRTDPELHSVYATTCPSSGKGSHGCTSHNYLDWAESSGTFRI